MSSSTRSRGPAPTPDDSGAPTAELPPASPTAEEIVATPAVEGDLNQEMKRVAKPFGKPTLVLAAVLVIALSFAGGAWTHAAFGSGSGAARTAGSGGGARGGFGGQQGAQGAQGTGQGSGGFTGARGRGTTGTVEKVDGSTVTLKTPQGTDVTVSTSDSTTVARTQPGTLSDLKPGTTVTVQGRTGSDGSVTAQAIVEQPAR